MLASAGVDEAFEIEGLFPEKLVRDPKIRTQRLMHNGNIISAVVKDEQYIFKIKRKLYMKPQGAHSAVNGAIALTRLGAQVTLVAGIGKDLYGYLLVEHLYENSVKFESFPRERTPFSFLLIDELKRKILFVRKDRYDIDLDDYPNLATLNPDYLLMLGLHSYELELATHVAGEKKVFDFLVPSGDFYTQLDDPAIKSFCKKVDTMQVSEREAEEMFDTQDHDVQIKAMQSLGPKTAIVTLGDKGLVWGRALEQEKHPAFLVPEVDPTGCGDTFAATYSFVSVAGGSVKACLTAGAWAAAQCAQHFGANVHTPNHFQLQHFVNTHHLLDDGSPADVPP